MEGDPLTRDNFPPYKKALKEVNQRWTFFGETPYQDNKIAELHMQKIDKGV